MEAVKPGLFTGHRCQCLLKYCGEMCVALLFIKPRSIFCRNTRYLILENTELNCVPFEYVKRQLV
jgi:hypothetical protein